MGYSPHAPHPGPAVPMHVPVPTVPNIVTTHVRDDASLHEDAVDLGVSGERVTTPAPATPQPKKKTYPNQQVDDNGEYTYRTLAQDI